jgi:acyl-CoA thioester hydrolase
MQIRVYYEDTDAGGIVYFANYLKFCERARSELFFQNNLSPHNNDSFFVVKHIDASYHSSAKLGDLLDVKTSIKIEKKVSVVLEQNIYKDETKLFSSEVTLAFLSSGKPAKIPKRFIEIFQTQFNLTKESM